MRFIESKIVWPREYQEINSGEYPLPTGAAWRLRGKEPIDEWNVDQENALKPLEGASKFRVVSTKSPYVSQDKDFLSLNGPIENRRLRRKLRKQAKKEGSRHQWGLWAKMRRLKRKSLENVDKTGTEFEETLVNTNSRESAHHSYMPPKAKSYSIPAASAPASQWLSTTTAVDYCPERIKGLFNALSGRISNTSDGNDFFRNKGKLWSNARRLKKRVKQLWGRC